MFSRRPPEVKVPPHFTPDHPESAQSHLELEPLNEQLIVEDHRPIMVKKRAAVLEPQFNRLYGTGRSVGDWRYFVDNIATGTFTTVANTAITAAVTFKLVADERRLLRWPQAVHMYLCIRKFSAAPQSAITTVGAVDVQYNDLLGGQLIPMGDFVSNSSISYDVDTIIPTTITDPGVTAVGNLVVTLTGTTPTVSVYNWQMGFSYVYLLPALEGYELERIHRVLPPKASDQ